MRSAQLGDRVCIHYVKRFQDGTVKSSNARGPVEVTVGVDDPRLPGLGLALVGLSPGEQTRITVPPEHAYGVSDPSRIRRCSRRRFPDNVVLGVGQKVRITDKKGRHRLVRIVQVDSTSVLVDANHQWAGQTLELEVELLAIEESKLDSGPVVPEPVPPDAEASPLTVRAGQPAKSSLAGDSVPIWGRAFAFDVDPASLASLQNALPGWEIIAIHGATVDSLALDWNPGAADLLIIGVRKDVADTLAMCRFLSFCTSYSTEGRQSPGALFSKDECQDRANTPIPRLDAPLLVLVLPGQETLVGAALEAGANCCLVLPLQVQGVVGVLARARVGTQPARQTRHSENRPNPDPGYEVGG